MENVTKNYRMTRTQKYSKTYVQYQFTTRLTFSLIDYQLNDKFHSFTRKQTLFFFTPNKDEEQSVFITIKNPVKLNKTKKHPLSPEETPLNTNQISIGVEKPFTSKMHRINLSIKRRSIDETLPKIIGPRLNRSLEASSKPRADFYDECS